MVERGTSGRKLLLPAMIREWHADQEGNDREIYQKREHEISLSQFHFVYPMDDFLEAYKLGLCQSFN
jgi:hypothetical protein